MRLDVADDAVLRTGSSRPTGAPALFAYVQLDEADSVRGVELRIPGLVPEQRYRVTWEGPWARRVPSRSFRPDEDGPTGGVPVSGAVLAEIGLHLPRRRPESILLIAIEAV